MRKWKSIVALAVGAVSGCAERPPAPTGPVALLGPQLQQQDAQLVGQHFRTLLDFEHDADAAFVDVGRPAFVAGHTGDHALRVGGAAGVNVESLLFGTALPGKWTLLGGYVRPDAGGDVTVTLLADGKPVVRNTRPVPAGAWAFIAVDLTDPACAAALPQAKMLSLRFDLPSAAALDDVLLVDNCRTLVDATADGGWKVETRGLMTSIVARGWSTALPAGGRAVLFIDEANALRVRAHDLAGHTRTLLADGRSIDDGAMTVLGGPGADRIASHRSPADITLDDTSGRVDRETAGDTDNDGYNERRGAYQLSTHAPRLTLTVRPRGATVVWPLLEVCGMPPGPVVVTVAGKLIDGTTRLADGTLLVLLPIRIEEPMDVTISTSGN